MANRGRTWHFDNGGHAACGSTSRTMTDHGEWVNCSRCRKTLGPPDFRERDQREAFDLLMFGLRSDLAEVNSGNKEEGCP